MQVQKNDIIKLHADGSTADGSAVCRSDSLVVFVPGGLPGEDLEVKILKVKSSCAYGKIEKILHASPDRIAPACDVSSKCGGCVFGHLDYRAELKIKQQTVADAFARIGGLYPEIEPIISGPEQRYRNKAQYPVSPSGEFGFFARHSHRVVSCDDCCLQPELFNHALAAVKRWMTEYKVPGYDESTGEGVVRHVYLRLAEVTGEIMVTIAANAASLPVADKLIKYLREAIGGSLQTLVLNINRKNTNVILSDKCKVLYGAGYITDVICGLKIRISPLSFYQVNRGMAEKIYEIAARYANPCGKVVLDLYCGAGTIGLSMADKADKVIGVEIIPQAVKDAEFNANVNGISNARFICADAAEAAARLEAEGVRPDVVILDPPRKGCDAALISTVAAGFAPERIVYVSCDPATLARDCVRFKELGYETVKAAPADMFPRTSHVETIVLMSRVKE